MQHSLEFNPKELNILFDYIIQESEYFGDPKNQELYSSALGMLIDTMQGFEDNNELPEEHKPVLRKIEVLYK